MGIYCSKCGINRKSHYVNLDQDRRHCRYHKFKKNNKECLHCSCSKDDYFSGCYHKWGFRLCPIT